MPLLERVEVVRVEVERVEDALRDYRQEIPSTVPRYVSGSVSHLGVRTRVH